MIVTYNNNLFGFPARFPVTMPVPAVALTLSYLILFYFILFGGVGIARNGG